MKVLLATPPLLDPQTPYPATAYLTGFLRHRGVECSQADLSIAFLLRLFSRQGMNALRAELSGLSDLSSKRYVQFFLNASDEIERKIDSVVRFLQGKDPHQGLKIANRQWLPESPRAAELWAYETRVAMAAVGSTPNQHFLDDPLFYAFGKLGVQDRARYLASVFLESIGRAIKEGIDQDFEIARYADKLTAGARNFSEIETKLRKTHMLDRILEDLTSSVISKEQPGLVGITVPFPGCLYGAFRIAQTIKRLNPNIRTVLGGGYVNTELRSINDPRVFDYFDFITFDDGERPLECILENLAGDRETKNLKRTLVRSEGSAQLVSGDIKQDVAQKDIGRPTYDGLDLSSYMTYVDVLNPMQRLWANGVWNKLTLAHGCYWKKCAFCDTSLDYIGRYDPAPVNAILDRMEALIAENGIRGFHFVDEAAPPAMLKALSKEIIRRKLEVSWWGNVRFDKAFDAETAGLMAEAGCVAVTGGLEVASDRLLKLMNKGTTVSQVARVSKHFSNAGIFVHAYLIYGFPTQTEQETIDALECVRQLFKQGCLKSAVWHKFGVTPFSPIGLKPDQYGIELQKEPDSSFSRYNIPYFDPEKVDHDSLGQCLETALFYFNHGSGYDLPVSSWFSATKKRKTFLSSHLVENALEDLSFVKI